MQFNTENFFFLSISFYFFILSIYILFYFVGLFFLLQNGVHVGGKESDGLGLCPCAPQHNSTAVYAGKN